MRWTSLIAIALLLAVPACSRSSGPTTPRGGTTGKDQSSQKEERTKPCHPGCFPAGTLVETPDGPRAIESLGRGDVVTLVGQDGVPARGVVNATFQTTNRLVEVRTESGNLVTTETQPLCLRDSGFRAGGELVEGDVIWQWVGDQRRAVRVRAVMPTGQETHVFNLVVDESAVFVAGGFLARGKPPADPRPDAR